MADKNVAPPTANAPVKKSRKRHIAHKKLHEAFALITRILRRLFSAAKLFVNIALLTILGSILILAVVCGAWVERQLWPDQQMLVGAFAVVSVDEKSQGDQALELRSQISSRIRWMGLSRMEPPTRAIVTPAHSNGCHRRSCPRCR
jgi:hypothetical protein